LYYWIKLSFTTFLTKLTENIRFNHYTSVFIINRSGKNESQK